MKARMSDSREAASHWPHTLLRPSMTWTRRSIKGSLMEPTANAHSAWPVTRLIKHEAVRFYAVTSSICRNGNQVPLLAIGWKWQNRIGKWGGGVKRIPMVFRVFKKCFCRLVNDEDCLLTNAKCQRNVSLENVLLNVLCSRFPNVQNRAIPKPSFNRVFQGGTGRGTNAPIHCCPKC